MNKAQVGFGFCLFKYYILLVLLHFFLVPIAGAQYIHKVNFVGCADDLLSALRLYNSRVSECYPFLNHPSINSPISVEGWRRSIHEFNPDVLKTSLAYAMYI